MLSNLSIPVITFTSPGAVAFHMGSLTIRWYGIFVAAGFLAVYVLSERLVIKNKYNLDDFNNLIFFMLIFSVIFARLWFVFLSWDYFKDHLSEIPKIWHGGQSIHGGMFGAVISAILYSKIKKISFYSYIDLFSVSAPLGQAIGRWGNFFNNEAFGRPVNNWIFKLSVPREFRPDQFINIDYFHPTFFYESFLDFVIFVFLYKKYSNWKEKKGKIFWMYLLCYSIIRFFLEFLRVDSLYLIGNIASAHIVSVIIIVISLYFLSRR